MSIGEFWSVKKSHFLLFWREAKKYYPLKPRFAIADLLVTTLYFFLNPYRIGRKHGEIYGETPFQSLHRIASFCSLTENDIWMDLGSGRGKGAFWIASFVGCRTIGIEKVPLFSRLANTVRRLVSIPSLEFVCQDILEADFSKATLVYFYSTCAEEPLLDRLAEKMQTMLPQTKVVTVSAPLPKNPFFTMIGAFPISFPWGTTDAYIHERKESSSTTNLELHTTTEIETTEKNFLLN